MKEGLGNDIPDADDGENVTWQDKLAEIVDIASIDDVIAYLKEKTWTSAIFISAVTTW